MVTMTFTEVVAALGDKVTSITNDRTTEGVTLSEDGLTANIYNVHMTDGNLDTMFPTTLTGENGLDLSGIDTSEMTDFSHLFNYYRYSVSGIEVDLDLSSWNTSNVTNMNGVFGGMFSTSGGSHSINISGWDTSKLTSMKRMFKETYISSIIGLESLDTSNVTDMTEMFMDSPMLTALDMSSWDTSNVTTMHSMFYGCRSLSNVSLSTWNTSNVTSMVGMFTSCSSLTDLDLSLWDAPNIASIGNMFEGCSSLTNLNLSTWNSSNISSISSTFKNCSSLSNLSLPSWSTSDITSLSYTFYGCSSLTSLDLSSWTTSKVTYMEYAFENCSSLKSLNLSNFTGEEVTSFTHMFAGCSSLTDLDISKFNPSKMIYLDREFENCSSLKELDLSLWDTSAVTGLWNTFYNCSSLTKLDLSSWDTSLITTTYQPFLGLDSTDVIVSEELWTLLKTPTAYGGINLRFLKENTSVNLGEVELATTKQLNGALAEYGVLAFGVCSDPMYDISDDSTSMTKSVTINGFTPRQGAKFAVKFENDCGGVRGTYNLQLSVNGVTKPVYCGKYQCGIGSINGGRTYEFIDDGTNYVKISDDIVASEDSVTSTGNERYIKHGNGLIEQSGYISLNYGQSYKVSLPLSYSDARYFVSMNRITERFEYAYYTWVDAYSLAKESFYLSVNNDGDVCWHTYGY